MTSTPNTLDPATLTKAVVRAAERLELMHALPDALGMSADQVEELRAGRRQLDPARDEWPAAIRFTALFRALLSLVGSVENARQWLNTQHQTLADVPAAMVHSQDGIERVMRYLEHVQKYEIKLPPRGSLQ